MGRWETGGLPVTDLKASLGLCRKELALASFYEFCRPWSFCSFISFFPGAYRDRKISTYSTSEDRPMASTLKRLKIWLES